MSILIETLAVVLRVEAIEARIPGGVPAFVAALPPGSVCSDGALARVGFLHAADALAFAEQLESAGFVGLKNGQAVEFVLLDPARGPIAPCAWAVFAHVKTWIAPGGPLAICKSPGTPDEPIVTPEGWEYETSLSKPFQTEAW